MTNNDLAMFLTAEEAAAVQGRVMQLLSEEILRYNCGRSSSVRVEKAQSLLESILYSITAYLQTVPDPAAALRDESAAVLRQNGIDLLDRYMEDVKKLLEEVKATRTPTELIAYNHTLDECFGEELDRYDPRFAAQETPCGLIDYPLLKDDMSVTGILYVKNYLTQLKDENRFCSGYKKNYIRALLLTHGKKHRLDYRQMLVNIPELILEQETPRP